MAKRRVQVFITEVYDLDIDTNEDGTDALNTIDEMDSDDQAACYTHRTVQVQDIDTGDMLKVEY